MKLSPSVVSAVPSEPVRVHDPPYPTKVYWDPQETDCSCTLIVVNVPEAQLPSQSTPAPAGYVHEPSSIVAPKSNHDQYQYLKV